jgi:hypothetical protein
MTGWKALPMVPVTDPEDDDAERLGIESSR